MNMSAGRCILVVPLEVVMVGASPTRQVSDPKRQVSGRKLIVQPPTSPIEIPPLGMATTIGLGVKRVHSR